jgi:hypothetical protein
MMRSRPSVVVIVTASLAAFGSLGLAAQDRYTLKIPDGLAWSDFRGYETWQDHHCVVAGGSQILMALSLYHPARMLRSWRALARVRGDDRRKAQIEPWVIHDIRRTMRTGLSALPVTLRAKAPAGRAALPRPHSLAPLQAS